jgi:hypothetical protein
MNKLILVIIIILFHIIAFSQERNWKEETSKDGLVNVKSEIVTQENEEGDEIKVMYYIAEREAEVSLEQLEQYMQNSESYKTIWENVEESKEIKKMSENEWFTYIYFDNPWPMANSDCVHHMIMERKDSKTLVVTAKSAPDAYEMKDVDRAQIFDALFTFENNGDGVTKLTLSVTFAANSNPPKWMMNGWFPKGPAGIVTRLMENAVKL